MRVGLDFKDVFTPEAANATAYSNSVVGTNTWQWWNKERGEWAVYAVTVAAKQPSEEPPKLWPELAFEATPQEVATADGHRTYDPQRRQQCRYRRFHILESPENGRPDAVHEG